METDIDYFKKKLAASFKAEIPYKYLSGGEKFIYDSNIVVKIGSQKKRELLKIKEFLAMKKSFIKNTEISNNENSVFKHMMEWTKLVQQNNNSIK